MLQKSKTITDDEGNEVKLCTFEEILPLLKNGEFVRRAGWSSCFAIYMPLRYQRDRLVSPAVGEIILLEASMEGGSTPNITVGWKPHTRDFLATDWYCVGIELKPRAIRNTYKPPPVTPISNINDIIY